MNYRATMLCELTEWPECFLIRQSQVNHLEKILLSHLTASYFVKASFLVHDNSNGGEIIPCLGHCHKYTQAFIQYISSYFNPLPRIVERSSFSASDNFHSPSQ